MASSHDGCENRTPVLLLYLGQRGAMPRFTLEATRAARATRDVTASVCVARGNELFASFAEFGDDLVGVDTFSSGAGAILAAWRIPLVRTTLADHIRARGVRLVIELMPHIWSPFLSSAIHCASARYVTIVHDASAHPGDMTALVNSILGMAAVRADRVVTLSKTVTDQLKAVGRVSSEKIVTLFHPDLSYGPLPVRRPREPDAPLRFLFFGRIMPYKGLGLFVDAIEKLRRSGIPVEAGVFGEGDMGAEGARLTALGAEVVNRWLAEDEIASVLVRHDVMVVSHIEASQSGVIATAFGAGLPVVATPVGALPEQVEHGVTGLVADAISAEALSTAIQQLALDHGLYGTLCEGVKASWELRSMQRFVRECVRLADE
jgi:glycosyltransferase involved in cell wall biosynthesis